MQIHLLLQLLCRCLLGAAAREWLRLHGLVATVVAFIQGEWQNIVIVCPTDDLRSVTDAEIILSSAAQDNGAKVRLCWRVIVDFGQFLDSLYTSVLNLGDLSNFAGVCLQYLLNQICIELLKHILQAKSIRIWRHGDFDLWERSNDGLVLRLLDTFQRPKHGQNVLTLFILFDRLH